MNFLTWPFQNGKGGKQETRVIHITSHYDLSPSKKQASETIEDNKWLEENCGKYYNVDIDGDAVKNSNIVMRLLALLEPNQTDDHVRRVRFRIHKESQIYNILKLINEAINRVHQTYRGPTVLVTHGERLGNLLVIYPTADRDRLRFQVINLFMRKMLELYLTSANQAWGSTLGVCRQSDHVATYLAGKDHIVKFVPASRTTPAQLEADGTKIAWAEYNWLGTANGIATNDEYLMETTCINLYKKSDECHNDLIQFKDYIASRFDCPELVSDTIFDDVLDRGTIETNLQDGI